MHCKRCMRNTCTSNTAISMNDLATSGRELPIVRSAPPMTSTICMGSGGIDFQKFSTMNGATKGVRCAAALDLSMQQRLPGDDDSQQLQKGRCSRASVIAPPIVRARQLPPHCEQHSLHSAPCQWRCVVCQRLWGGGGGGTAMPLTWATTGMSSTRSAVDWSAGPSLLPEAAASVRRVPACRAWDVLVTSDRSRLPSGLRDDQSQVHSAKGNTTSLGSCIQHRPSCD